MMKKIIKMAMITAMCLMAAACGKGSAGEVPQDTVEAFLQETQTDTAEQTTEAIAVIDSEADREGMVKSKISGMWVEEALGNRRAVAVMFNNIKDAVPQSGIEQADIVYEVPVEGALTRLMGIMESYDTLDKIGSVRSCRLYFLYFAKEFDAIYVHWGQAIYAEDLLFSDKIDNLNGLQMGEDIFYRSSDRVAPHNGYTSAQGITNGIAEKKYRTDYTDSYEPKFKFAEDEKEVTLANGISAAKVTPGYSVNKAWFEYNETEKLYYRYQYGGAQIDDRTGEQLAYKNIVIQVNDYYDYGDGYYYVYTTGSGAGKYITNGKAIDITWKKESDFAPAKYYDMAGNEITVNQGKTWICVVFKGRESYIEIN